jgi:dihydrofolate reductase
MAKVILGVTISLDGLLKIAKAVWAHYILIWMHCERPTYYKNPYAPPEKCPKETDKLTFTFVTDGIVSAIRQAKVAAGRKDVTIIGSAATTQQVLTAGLADELQIDIIPIFLHKGFRPFEHVDENIKLKKIRVVEAGERTSLQFLVER